MIGWIVDRFGLGFVPVFAGRQQHRHWVATVETLAGDAIATLRQAMWQLNLISCDLQDYSILNLKCTQEKYIERAANQYVKMHNI